MHIGKVLLEGENKSCEDKASLWRPTAWARIQTRDADRKQSLRAGIGLSRGITQPMSVSDHIAMPRAYHGASVSHFNFSNGSSTVTSTNVGQSDSPENFSPYERY